MTKTIVASFTDNAVPATGLSATIRIRTVSDGALVVTDAAMTEVGDGFYKYDFTTYDESLDYSIRCYGGASLPVGERYTYATNESYVEDIWGAQLADHEIVGSMAEELRSSGGGGGGGLPIGQALTGSPLTAEQAEALAKMVWDVMLDGERSAREVLLSRSDFKAMVDKVVVGQLPPEFAAEQAQVRELLGPLSQFVDNFAAIKAMVSEINFQPEITVQVPPELTTKLEGMKNAISTLATNVSDVTGSVRAQAQALASTVDKLNAALKSGDWDSVTAMIEQITEAADDLDEVVDRLEESDQKHRTFLKNAALMSVVGRKK